MTLYDLDQFNMEELLDIMIEDALSLANLN